MNDVSLFLSFSLLLFILFILLISYLSPSYSFPPFIYIKEFWSSKEEKKRRGKIKNEMDDVPLSLSFFLYYIINILSHDTDDERNGRHTSLSLSPFI